MSFNQRYRNVLRLIILPLLISTFLLHTTLLSIGHAQVATAITSDGTMGTTVTRNGNVYNITDGLRKTDNLFHSFGLFSVGEVDTASFNGPAGIANILSRVTGGVRSDIYGTLRSTIDGANLYLFNPNGVVFGPNASLDVSGSFHVSTADYVELNDGVRFNAIPGPQDALLTTAPVKAFGFLSDNPSPISIEGSTLVVPVGETLSVIGGDINVEGGSLKAPSGQINIASVASQGEVIPNATGDSPDLNVDSFSSLGEIDLSQNSLIDAGGDGGGTVVIRGGRFMMDSSFVYASTTGPAVGPLVGDPGAGIDIQVTEDVVLDNGSQIGTNVWQNVAPGIGSGGIRVKAERLEVANNSEIQSIVYWQSTGGKSGDIEIDAKSVIFRDGGWIRTATGSSGAGGNITITNARNLEVLDGAKIDTYAFAGTGKAGDINIVDAESVLLSNTNVGGMWTAIASRTWGGTGNAGNVSITSDSLQILGGGNTEISSVTWWQGNGGNVDLTIDGDISMSGSIDNPFGTGIFANTFGFGDGGNLNVKSGSLNVTTSSLQSRTFWTANAGNTTINTGSLELLDGGAIYNDGFFGSGGSGGNMEVTADSVFISGFKSHPDPFGNGFTGLSTIAGANGGDSGLLSLTTNSLIMTQRGQIAAYSRGPGKGGNIEIIEKNAGSGIVQLLDGSQIISNAFGSGDAGYTKVVADSLLISGVNNEPFSGVDGNPTLAFSGIVSQAGIGGGNAGEVLITVGSLKVLDGGTIGASTFGTGNASNVVIKADDVLVSGENLVAKEFFSSNPIGGLSYIGSSSNSTYIGDAATGHAGSVQITANGNLQVQDKGRISTGTVTPGTGGNLELVANQVTLSGGASISATSGISLNSGKAGDISITTHHTFQSDSSTVKTSAEVAEGGDITITAGQDVLLRNGTVVSAETFGEKDAGKITINASNSVSLLNASLIKSNTVDGQGGSIQIDVPDLSLSGGSFMSASSSGAGQGGSVNLNVADLSLDGGSNLETTGAGAGDAGSVTVNAANSVSLLNSSGIFGETEGSGKGGSVNINAVDLTFDNDSGIQVSSFGSGEAGSVLVNASNSVSLLNSSGILSDTSGSGQGGSVNMNVVDLTLNDSLISADSSEKGDAGSVTVNAANSVSLLNSSMINSSSLGTGQGGSINLDVNDLTLDDGKILALSDISGDAGSVTINATNSVSLLNSGVISSDTTGTGRGGSINLAVSDLALDDGFISASSIGTGDAGSVTIKASNSVSLLNSSGIASFTDSSGQGGSINLDVSDLTLDNISSIGTFTRGSGDAGSVTINATNSVNLFNSSLIDSSTLSSGKGGSVNLDVVDLTLNDSFISASSIGTGDAGSVTINATNSVLVKNSGRIKTDTTVSGQGGSINLNVIDLTLDGGTLDASSSGTKGAGTIALNVGNLTLTNLGWISTSSEGSSGNAGNITIKATDSFNMSGESFVASSTSGEGDGGIVTIMVGDTFQSDNSAVLTSAEKAKGGDITITAGQNVLLRNGSLISAESSGAGDSGNIYINAGNTYLSENSSVTTVSKQADGGNIELIAQYMAHLINSEISSSVDGGPDTAGGNITIDPEYVILQNSRIMANAFEGKGGNISITAGVFLADPNSIVSASSARGIDGEVDIRAPVTNISGSISQLQKNYSSAASLLLKPCAVRMSGGQQSSLVVAGRDGLPMEPGGLLPSPLYSEDVAEDDAKVAKLWDKPALSYGMNVFEEKGLLPLAMLDDDSGCSTCPE